MWDNPFKTLSPGKHLKRPKRMGQKLHLTDSAQMENVAKERNSPREKEKNSPIEKEKNSPREWQSLMLHSPRSTLIFRITI